MLTRQVVVVALEPLPHLLAQADELLGDDSTDALHRASG
jgi:hypothetical protein